MSFNSETIQVFLTVLDRGSFSAAALQAARALGNQHGNWQSGGRAGL